MIQRRNPFAESEETEEVDDADVETEVEGSKKFKLTARHYQIIAVAIVAMVVVILMFISNKDPASKPVDAEVDGVVESQRTSECDPQRPWTCQGGEPVEGDLVDDDAEIQTGLIGINPHAVMDEGGTVNTFDGTEVAEHYNVSSISTVKGFVSYKLMREITSEGIELYWLDALYKDKPAKISIPYSIAKDLDSRDILEVEVEITKVYDSNYNVKEIVTGFTVPAPTRGVEGVGF